MSAPQVDDGGHVSEPNSAQAVIASVLQKSMKPLVDPFDTGADGGWVEAWCDSAAASVDAALGGLTREHSKATRNCSYPGSDGPCVGKHHGRWVSGWTPEETQA